MHLANLRDLFLIDPNIIFFNHGSFGACPRPVFEVYQDWQRELERQPVEFLGRRFGALMEEARGVLAAFLSTGQENLFYTTNATTALNIVARSLPLGPGDEILSNDHEYGALDQTWEFVCSKRGCRYVRPTISLPIRSAEEVIETIWQGVSERTRVLFISHITSPTGLIFPIAPLIRRARERGILTVIDGAHAPGQVPLDLEALGADFYAGNCHKWLMSPKGAAFLYARPEVQPLLEPLVVSWRNMSLSASPFIAANEFQGTRDIAAYLSVPAAIQFRKDYNWDNVQEYCYELLVYARREILKILGLPAICPEDPEWICQMAAHLLPPGDGAALKTRLYEEYGIEIPVQEMGAQQFLRISIQGYNTRSEVDTLLRALGRLIPEYTTC